MFLDQTNSIALVFLLLFLRQIPSCIIISLSSLRPIQLLLLTFHFSNLSFIFLLLLMI